MSNLLIEKEGRVQIITINRPDKLNALNRETIAQLSEAMKEAEASNEVGVIVIRGAGEKAFVAGADISEFHEYDRDQAKALSQTGHTTLFDLVENTQKPVIAAINGFALGGGLELAMSCHIRVAATSAKMGLPEVSLGVIPGYGGTQRLAQLAGKGKAFEMIFTAGMIGAAEAKEVGLVNHVVEQSELMDKCMEIAKQILRNSPTAIAAAIRSVNAGYAEGLDGFGKEIEEFANCFLTADFKEGTDAFLSKRKPNFSGE
jgi:enoyl-CoA hydratase